MRDCTSPSKDRPSKGHFLLGAALLGLIPISPAFAQDSSGATDGTEQPEGLGEIIVTARKRSENLQSTPIAITAVGAQDLEVRGAVDLTTVNNIAPNVSIRNGGGVSGAGFTPVINIRGIGQSDFTINTDPGVGIYLDGVYLGRSVGSVLDLADAERVEVLRGPQGTLFGRNTIGGAVSLVSKAPSPDGAALTASAAAGSRQFVSLQAAGNLPLGENLALRVSGMFRHRQGYVKALQYDDFYAGGEEVWGIRAALRWTPAEWLTIDLSGDHTERGDTPAPAVALRLGNVSPTGTGTTGNGSTFFNSGVGPAATARLPNISTAAPRCAADPIFRDSSIACYGNAWLAGTSGTNSVWYDQRGAAIRPENRLNLSGFSGTIAVETPLGTLKSITAHREFESTFYSDLDFTPYVIFHNNNVPYDQKQFSQEIQLVGDAFDGRLSYVFGYYYFKETGDEAVDLLTPGDIPAALAASLAPGLPYFQTTTRYIDNRSQAAYGQLTFAVTDSLKLTGGLRYTDDSKDYRVTQTRIAGAQLSGTGQQTSKIWTPMVNVAWQITPDVMTYATYSEGYRAGGFAARFPGGLPTPLPSFNPESVKSYELGLKSSLFDRRLTFNLAAFRVDYDDIQVTATVASLPGFTLNLANARFTGIEAEARAVLGGGFRANFSAGYIKKELLSVLPGTQSSSGTNAVVNITTDSRLPGPEWQLNAQLEHRFELSNGARIDSTFDLHFESSDSNSVANYAIIERPGYVEANTRVGYTTADDRWTFAVGARNLFDKRYFTTKTLSSASGSAFGTVAQPREVYVQMIVRLGR